DSVHSIWRQMRSFDARVVKCKMTLAGQYAIPDLSGGNITASPTTLPRTCIPPAGVSRFAGVVVVNEVKLGTRADHRMLDLDANLICLKSRQHPFSNCNFALLQGNVPIVFLICCTFPVISVSLKALK